ncbi:MAG: hypothetical protein OEL84_08945 [Nitrosopumilus sp.]|nr:hypothetical protein [Nitrosopumilus sp.]
MKTMLLILVLLAISIAIPVSSFAENKTSCTFGDESISADNIFEKDFAVKAFVEKHPDATKSIPTNEFGSAKNQLVLQAQKDNTRERLEIRFHTDINGCDIPASYHYSYDDGVIDVTVRNSVANFTEIMNLIKSDDLSIEDFYPDGCTFVDLDVTMSNGKSYGICKEGTAVTILIDAARDGYLEVGIPISMVYSLPSSDCIPTGDFFVMLDREEARYEITPTENGNLVKVEFSEGFHNIMILGSVIIPDPSPAQYCGIVEGYLDRKYLAPLDQTGHGVAPKSIRCNEDLILIQKHDETPACIREQSVQKLIKRGWALQNDKQTGAMAPLSEAIREQNVANSAGLSIMPEMINGKNYLVFEGVGWHRLHNVEITITDNDGKNAASIRSKTNSNGVLHMPWSLPEDFPRGMYQVHATDGIHQNNLVFSVPTEIPVDGRSDSSELNVDVSGEKQVRRGTTHSIEIQVDRDKNPVDDAQVFIRIEDYGEDIVREFHGRTNQQGYLVFSWEIPKKFDDIETLLAFVDVTDGISSKTELFKFVVYCLPGEKGCKTEGN